MRLIRLNDGENLYIEKGHLKHSTLSSIDRSHVISCQYNEGVIPVDPLKRLYGVRSLFMKDSDSEENAKYAVREFVLEEVEKRMMEREEVVEVLFLTHYGWNAYPIEDGRWRGEMDGIFVGVGNSPVWSGKKYWKGAP